MPRSVNEPHVHRFAHLESHSLVRRLDLIHRHVIGLEHLGNVLRMDVRLDIGKLAQEFCHAVHLNPVRVIRWRRRATNMVKVVVCDDGPNYL